MVMEQLVVVISPLGIIHSRAEASMEVLVEEGFLIVDKKEMLIGRTEAKIITERDDVDANIFELGPSIVLLVRRQDAFTTLANIRPDLDDVYYSPENYCALRDQKIFFPQDEALERTLVIIKPEFSPEDIATVMDAVESNDFVVIAKLQTIIQTDTAKLIFQDRKDDVEFVTSDVCHCMVLERVAAVDTWQLLMGPRDSLWAKEIAPMSLRALLGNDLVHNAVYGSATVEKAKLDISLIFPAPFPLERTLAIIKPNAMDAVEEVMKVIKQSGFTVTAKEMLSLSKNRAEELYADHKGMEYFDILTSFMSSDVCLALVLTKPKAVDSWHKLMGNADPQVARQENPNSLRALYGLDVIRNGFHGSDPEKAEAEIDLYFPQLSVETIPKINQVKALMRKKELPRPFARPNKSLHDVLTDGFCHLCRVKPVGLDAIRYLAKWLKRNNPNKPTVLQAPELSSTEPTTVVQQISESEAAKRTGEAVKVVWVVGGPGAGKNTQCARIVNEFSSFELITPSELVAAAEKQSNQFGAMIQTFRKQGRSVPTHIIVSLIKQAMLASKATRFVLKDFPKNLDEAFTFQKEVGAPDTVLYLDGLKSTLASRAANSDAKLSNDEHESRMQTFEDDVIPVISHYQSFEKVKIISAEGSERHVYRRIQKLFQSPLLQ